MVFNKMLQKSNFSIEAAVANCSVAMEVDAISKNGQSSKSHTCRGSLLKMAVLFCVIFCTSVGVWGQKYEFKDDERELSIIIDLDNYIVEYIVFEKQVVASYSIDKDAPVTVDNRGMIAISITHEYGTDPEHQKKNCCLVINEYVVLFDRNDNKNRIGITSEKNKTIYEELLSKIQRLPTEKGGV